MPDSPFEMATPSGERELEDDEVRQEAQHRLDDLTQMPTTPQPSIWQYTSPHYAAESSLSSLSLVTSDTVLHSRALPAIALDEIATQPPRRQVPCQEVCEAPTLHLPQAPGVPGKGMHPAARPRSTGPLRKRGSIRPTMRGVEALRWWLLYPGRIEFLAWLVGALLLISLSIMLVPLTFVSLMPASTEAANTAHRQAVMDASTTATSLCSTTRQGGSACDALRVTAANGLEITLLAIQQAPGETPLQLHGRGFTARGQVRFTCDTARPCRPALLRSDAHGMFSVSLLPGDGADWAPGWHQVTVNDVATKHAVSLSFTLLTVAPPSPTASSLPPV